MGCYTCGGNPNTWCTKCMPAEDTWVAPVDSLPDVFMGDRDHMYLLPNGDLFILSPDRTRWIKVNGTGNTTAYDDTALKARVSELEKVKYKDKDTTVYPYTIGEIVTLGKGNRVRQNEYKTYTYKITSSNKPLTEPFIENILQFDFQLYEKNSITGETYGRPGTNFSITKVARQFEELYTEQTYALTNNTSLLVKLNTIWKDTDNKFTAELGLALIYKEKEGDFVREYRHDFTADEIDSGEQAHISVQVDGVEKGYSKLTLRNVAVGMSNFGYRVYKQVGDGAYTKLETINE